MRSISRFVGVLLLSAAATSGCSLYLDFDEEGLACAADRECLEGFVCNGANVCMPAGHPSTVCRPECGPLERCVGSECVPVCDDRACPAGASCHEGACKMNSRQDLVLGSPCTNDSHCRKAESLSVCLRPYGGGEGVCTRPCTADYQCEGLAPLCVNFPNGGNGQKLCVNSAFTPCNKEGECTDSGLTCGVFALEAETFGNRQVISPISACRERLPGQKIGAKCSPSLPCANGVCALVDESNATSTCTTPCEGKEECGILDGGGHECVRVTLNPTGANGLPRTRPKLCSPGGVSTGDACRQSSCRADAPYCRVDPKDDELHCMTACGDGDADCPGGRVCTPQDDNTTPDLCVSN